MQLNIISVAMVFLASVVAAMGLGGGSVLLLYLSLATSLPQPVAQAVNLLLFVPTAALSLIIHHKNGLVNTSCLKTCLPGGLLGGLLGSLVGNRINPAILGKLFGVFLLFVGIRELMLARRLFKSARRPPAKGDGDLYP